MGACTIMHRGFLPSHSDTEPLEIGILGAEPVAHLLACPFAHASLSMWERKISMPDFLGARNQCSFSFSLSSPRSASAHADNSLFCEICGLKFTSQSELTLHRQKQHSQDQLECAHCQEKFESETELKKHNKSSHNGKKILCPGGWWEKGELQLARWFSSRFYYFTNLKFFPSPT